MLDSRLKYLKLLSRQFPTIQAASQEIINLEAITNLPKGTEHFLSDLHGEHEAFLHILKNGSGVVKRKIEDVFGSKLSEKEKSHMASLIYYPKETLAKYTHSEEDYTDWYHTTLHNLVLVCREVSSKYTRSKVRKALPKGFEYILEELLNQQENVENKEAYYERILNTIIEIEQAEPFIVAMSELIQRFAIDHLHIIGDIYDRGQGPDIILNKLMEYHSLDIQWGNHDIVWMGAYAGSLPCIANVIRISMRYGNQDTLEEAYGINLLPLAKFAMENYAEVGGAFNPKVISDLDQKDVKLIAQMHKAITVIMFKLEGHYIERNPEYHIEDRLLLNMIDYDQNKITLNHTTYDIEGYGFPTIDKEDPYKLSADEMEIMLKLKGSFMTNEKLKAHVDFLIAKGGIYKIYNDHLLYHGCIPTNSTGEFTKVIIDGEAYRGKRLLEKYEMMVRKAYHSRYKITDERELDIFYYLWTGENSSLFGKNVMKTFERYFIKDKSIHEEMKNGYYSFNYQADYCDKIFKEFGMDKDKARIVNGHVPVKVGKGENPVKADGKMIVIDGGLSKAYQPVTDIAGYTLISNSHGILLATHKPFESAKVAIDMSIDLISEVSIIKAAKDRIRVGETDIGKILVEDITDLKELLSLYRSGVL